MLIPSRGERDFFLFPNCHSHDGWQRLFLQAMVMVQTIPKRTWRCHVGGYALVFAIPRLADSPEAATQCLKMTAWCQRHFRFILDKSHFSKNGRENGFDVKTLLVVTTW